MTKEELETQAKEYTKESMEWCATENVKIKQAYKDGYEACQKDLFSWTDREQLEKENAELKAENEKLRKQMKAVQKICFDSCL